MGAVPRDPFSGEPFGYSREERLIWSVGMDGERDQASGPEGKGEGDDGDGDGNDDLRIPVHPRS
ncbi:MAG: hypothetical protein ACE5GW_02165 [Planctomycetota bacterium]